MAAQFWAGVSVLQIGLVLALARAIAVSGLWLIPVVAAGIVAVQFATTLLTMLLSVALAADRNRRSDFTASLGVVLSETLYFGLAQLSMSFTRKASRSRNEARDASPLLLVHGLACNHGIWRWLIKRLRSSGFRSIYVIDLEPLRADIDMLARQLEREVLRIYDLHGQAPLTIIAHSMGGLVARAALRSLPPRAVRRIVTIGTPHHGAAIARVLRWLPAKQICPASRWLASLNALQEGQLPVAMTSVGSVDDNLVRPSCSFHLDGARVLELHGLGHFGLLISKQAIARVIHTLQEVP